MIQSPGADVALVAGVVGGIGGALLLTIIFVVIIIAWTRRKDFQFEENKVKQQLTH